MVSKYASTLELYQRTKHAAISCLRIDQDLTPCQGSIDENSE